MLIQRVRHFGIDIEAIGKFAEAMAFVFIGRVDHLSSHL
jgi:hypothetical protein